MKKFYNSRWGQYLIYITTYTIAYEIIGFELTMIILAATILGEIHYQFKN